MTGCHLNGATGTMAARATMQHVARALLGTLRRATPAARGKDGRVWKADTCRGGGRGARAMLGHGTAARWCWR